MVAEGQLVLGADLPVELAEDAVGLLVREEGRVDADRSLGVPLVLVGREEVAACP